MSASTSNGERPKAKSSNRRSNKKEPDDYAAAYPTELMCSTVTQDGNQVRLLTCRFCLTPISPRSDRIKDHFKSKRHQQCRQEVEGHDENQELGEDLNTNGNTSLLESLLMEPPLLDVPVMALTPPPSEASSDLAMAQLPRMDNQSYLNTPTRQQPKRPVPLSLQQTLESDSGNGMPDGSLSVNGSGESKKRRMMGGNRSTGDGTSSSSGNVAVSQQLLCVRWNHFQPNVVSMFSKFRKQGHFLDVTLWCEGKALKCHKLVLCAGSTHFEKLFMEHPHQLPVIIITGIRFWAAQALVNFMYEGEVKVEQDNLPEFLNAAESLQIKGLVHNPEKTDN